MVNKATRQNIIELEHFVQATRDSGYKGTAAALAELIDNSFEANATEVNILIRRVTPAADTPTIIVVDNGDGMLPSVLNIALRFGGSTRFNSRRGTGRFGMGLPNSSLSRARRVDVYSWTSSKAVWWSHLDLDEIITGRMKSVPKAKRAKLALGCDPPCAAHGTAVVWSNCDRIEFKYVKALSARLRHILGKTFRWQLWDGKSITINGEPVRPVDPLFLKHKIAGLAATQYGEDLSYEVLVPRPSGSGTSTVNVRFTELPVEAWHRLTNEEKRVYGISKQAGISIVRAGREVDHGWYFMGSKRKENYDDWWRGEVSFDPVLDELFGVTNTKQGISPTEDLKSMLTPDLERTAKKLNSRVRAKFLRVKAPVLNSLGANIAESKDVLLEPPAQVFRFATRDDNICDRNWASYAVNSKSIIKGLKYRIECAEMEDTTFFVPKISRKELVLILNKRHPFYRYVSRLKGGNIASGEGEVLQLLELILFAVVRVECDFIGEDKLRWMRELRESWGMTLASYLS